MQRMQASRRDTSSLSEVMIDSWILCAKFVCQIRFALRVDLVFLYTVAVMKEK